jgi:hypothetical protein
VAAVRAAIGDDLLAVELGNEYDHVTTLTAAGYYAEMKRYRDAIAAAVPGVPLKMTGPSANTASTNTKLDDFVTAVLADPAPQPQSMFSELASHWYPGSHCGSSTTSIRSLMSDRTVLRTRAKLEGIMAIGARLEPSVPMVINESNSASCSGQAGVSDSYATALWGLDYLMQTAQSGVGRLSFHTSTAALCGRLEARDSPLYPISYRFYAAFCAPDRAALDAGELEAAPLYYGIWAFRQVPPGRFLDLDLPDAELPRIRAYAVQAETGDVTAVLVNVQDPAAAESTEEVVTLNLPGTYRRASSIVLESSSPGGLASTARDGITLGRRDVTSKGVPRGEPKRVPIESSTVTVAPGTAQIVTFER